MLLSPQQYRLLKDKKLSFIICHGQNIIMMDNKKMDYQSNQKIQFKVSQFNEYLGRIDEKWVLYNYKSGAMISIEKDLYDVIQKCQIEKIQKKNLHTY